MSAINAWANPPSGRNGQSFDSPTFTGPVSGGVRVLAQSFSPVSCGADVTEDTLATITVPANIMGANGVLRIVTAWTYTNSVNNKTLRVKWGGTAWHTYTVTTTAVFLDLLLIANQNATNSQFSSGQNASAYGASTNANTTASVDTTAATTITITGQKASSGETLTLNGYTVEVLRP